MAEFERCRNNACDFTGSRHAHPVLDGDGRAAREKVALYIFEQRLKDLHAASKKMIDACVALRDARAALQSET